MIYSGLDWSGSPGREQGATLVFAIVHIDAANLPKLEVVMNEARDRLGRNPDFSFKHTRVKPFADVHRNFYEAIGRVDWGAHVHVLDKATWNARRQTGDRGIDCIRDGIVALVIGCPDAMVANQILFIDLPSTEARIVQDCRTAVRKALRGVRRTGFKDVRPCPDHRQHGALVQVADMIAGEAREHGGLSGPFLPGLRSRIHIVR